MSKKNKNSEPSPTAETAVPSTVGEGLVTLDDLAPARLVELATKQPKSHPLLLGGVLVTPEARVYMVGDIPYPDSLFDHLDQVTIRIIE